MSFGFGVGDFIVVGNLVMKLCQDYTSAPEEGRSLANDLSLLHDCIAGLEEPFTRCDPDEREHLHSILQRVHPLLQEIGAITEKFSSLHESQPRVWDRLKFPRLQIQALQKRVHLQISTLHLFVSSLSNRSLARIEQVLEEIGRAHGGNASRVQGSDNPNHPEENLYDDEDNWNILLAGLQQRGIDRESAVQHRLNIQQHLVALSEVEMAESQLSDASEYTIIPDDAVSHIDPLHGQDIVFGPPNAEDIVSWICPGALLLQEGRHDAIRIVKRVILRHFTATKFKLFCRRCGFYGFQDEPIKTPISPLNTPLFFHPRGEDISSSSIEYYLEIHKHHHGRRDGIYYRALFFWKCHVSELQSSSPKYECVFCPAEKAFGIFYTRDSLLEHIREDHIQNPPSHELRKKFGVYIDHNPAVFESERERFIGRKFDILLPRARGRTDILKAEQAQREAQAEAKALRPRR